MSPRPRLLASASRLPHDSASPIARRPASRRPALALALGAASLLVACASAPPPKSTPPVLPAAYPAAADTRPGAALASNWWTLFGDATLDARVAEALQHNLDLRLATARIDEAAVALGLARSAQWPQVDLGGSVTRSRVSAFGSQPVSVAETTSHRVALSTTFEIDLWGRLHNATQAAQDQLLAAVYARDAVQVALAGTVVQTVFGVRALDVQLAVLDDQLRQRDESLKLIERRVAGGLASGLELAQAQGALAAAAAQRPELLRQRRLLVHQLGVLTGRLDTTLEPSGKALPLPVRPPAGLPSELLARRPDVQQAEASMRAAFEQFDVTRKGAWPTLSLTGSFGAQSRDLTDLLRTGARIWSIGPSLLVSVFDAGRNTARTDEARARAEQAALVYQKATQTAFRDVADALANGEQTAAQEADVERQRKAADEALRIARRRHEAGYSGYLEVLDAQRGVLDAELAAVRVRQAQLDASVNLMKALGGGWKPPAAR